MHSLYEEWRGRDPSWANRFRENLLYQFTNYRKGSEQIAEAKGKTFGSGYELFIIAFFIGLYSDKTRQLPLDGEKAHFGVPIKDWGNFDPERERFFGNYRRENYNLITKYMFVALVVKCIRENKINFIQLDNGEMSVKDAASILTHKMEEFANYGFQYLSEKCTNDLESMFRPGAFFDIISELCSQIKSL